MKIATLDLTFDGEQEPIYLVFQSDWERKRLIKALVDMPEQKGPQVYSYFEDEYVKEGHRRAIELHNNPKGY